MTWGTHAVESDVDAPVAVDDAVRIVDALGVAFATFQLFQAPDAQPALQRAVGILREAPDVGAVEVASDHFLWSRSPVASTHPGAERLAARLFAHGVAAVRFIGPPGVEDLRTLFDVIRRNPNDALLSGGVGRALEQNGGTAIRLIDRAPLIEANETEPDETPKIWGEQPTVDAPGYSGSAEALAHRLLTEAGQDPDALIPLIGEQYLGALVTIDANDFEGREDLVHTFVDAFFYLPKSFQGPLLAEFLARRDEAGFQMLLDQFAHHELHELAPYLDRESHPLLVEYARMTLDEEPPSDELDTLIGETEPQGPQGVPITARIARLLEKAGSGVPPARQALLRIREQIADPAHGGAPAAGVMRSLLSLTATPAQQAHLLRIWARKLTRTIQDGDYEAIVEWAAIVLDHDETDRSEIADALGRTADVDTVRSLIPSLPDSPTFHPVIERLCSFLVLPAIEALGDEGDARRRRVLIRMLSIGARSDPTPVIDALDDPRWYLVRNLVLVLGRSGDPASVAAVTAVGSHPDPRVRREAVRAKHVLEGHRDIDFFLQAMRDEDASVRSAASTVLRLEEHPAVAGFLLDVVDGDDSIDVKVDAIALLGACASPGARSALEDLAGRRALVSPHARALRNAAREALEERT